MCNNVWLSIKINFWKVGILIVNLDFECLQFYFIGAAGSPFPLKPRRRPPQPHQPASLDRQAHTHTHNAHPHPLHPTNFLPLSGAQTLPRNSCLRWLGALGPTLGYQLLATSLFAVLAGGFKIYQWGSNNKFSPEVLIWRNSFRYLLYLHLAFFFGPSLSVKQSPISCLPLLET